ncbi:MAG: cache domain-containing protein [Thermotogaceae bacterium]|nr:cache domain-containing protein [Thermotogaceae bacterium]
MKKDETGKTIGLFALTVTFDKLEEVLEDLRVGKSSFGWVVDSSGMVIASPKKKLGGDHL